MKMLRKKGEKKKNMTYSPQKTKKKKKTKKKGEFARDVSFEKVAKCLWVICFGDLLL